MLKKTAKYSFFILIIVLVSAIALPQNSLRAQSNLRIFEDIGGGGDGTTSSSSDSDNSFIYIAGGLVIAGVIAYALFINKDKKSEVETDSTQAFNQLKPIGNALYSNSFEKEITAVKESFPVDILMGIRRDDAFLSDQTYIMGVSVRF